MTTVAIVGGGVGGLTAYIALKRLGIDATVFEQAPAFARVGADLNLTPNAVKALDGLGLGPAIRTTAARPTFRISRTWDTGEETSRIPMSDEAERKYGSPQLTIHRAEVMNALLVAVDPADLVFGKHLDKIVDHRDANELVFVDGTTAEVDVVIGADGIHSAVRNSLFGPDNPVYTGIVAYRAVVPSDRLPDLPNLDAFTKWWGPDPSIQLVVFPLNRGNDIFVFATVAQEEWSEESWTAPGDMSELREHYSGFHPEARALLDACDSVLKSALRVRDPLPTWTSGTVTLLGDAAHPMTPFMAQGAGMAIEDAVVLSRALAAGPLDDRAAIVEALARYERARLGRTAKVQVGSRNNNWLRDSGDADWLYGYDVWTVGLD
jgi:salicylate hydroxylase